MIHLHSFNEKDWPFGYPVE